MKRLIPGLLIAALWLVTLLLAPPFLFHAVLIILTLIGSKEYVRMVVKTHEEESRSLILIPFLSLPAVGVSLFGEQLGLQLGLIISFISVTTYILFSYNRKRDIFRLFCQSIFGVVYVGCLFAFLLMIYQLESGNLWLIILTAITAGSDTGAYVVGKNFGKHLLCPHISPKKTVEGAFGGLFFGILAAAIFSQILLPEANLLLVIIVSGLLTVVSMTGDIVESIIKRGTDTKDSGTILAGHGGVLDRLDSMLFAAPFLYYLLYFTGGI